LEYRDAVFVSSLPSIPEEEEEEQEYDKGDCEDKTGASLTSVTSALHDSSPRKQTAVLYPALKPADDKFVPQDNGIPTEVIDI